MENRIEKRIELKAPVERVWRALTDYREFGEWFRVKLEGPFVAGQMARGHVTWPGYEHVKWEATVQKMEEGRLFSYTWHPYSIDPKIDYSKETPTLVEFRLEKTAGGTLLTLTESGFENVPESRRAEAFRRNDGGCAQQIKNIEVYVAEQPWQHARAAEGAGAGVCGAGRRDAAGPHRKAQRRGGALDCAVDAGIAADKAGDHEAPANAGAGEDRALRAGGAGEPVRAESRANREGAGVPRPGVGAVGPGAGKAEGVGGGLSVCHSREGTQASWRIRSPMRIRSRRARRRWRAGRACSRARREIP